MLKILKFYTIRLKTQFVSSKLPCRIKSLDLRNFFDIFLGLCVLGNLGGCMELYTGTPISDIRILFTVHCGRNVNKPSAPTEVEGKGLKVWCDITVQQKTMIFGFLVNMENTIAIYSYSTPLALFPQKWCVAPEFFVWISSQCSTRIWRMRYGGSWSIYFLGGWIYLD